MAMPGGGPMGGMGGPMGGPSPQQQQMIHQQMVAQQQAAQQQQQQQQMGMHPQGMSPMMGGGGGPGGPGGGPPSGPPHPQMMGGGGGPGPGGPPGHPGQQQMGGPMPGQSPHPGHMMNPGGVGGPGGPGGPPSHPGQQQHPPQQQQQGHPPPQQQQQQQQAQMGAGNQTSLDNISKAKSLVGPIKDNLSSVLRTAAHAIYANNMVDSGSKPVEYDVNRFDRCLEEFFSLCDQMEIHLKTSIECINQGMSSSRYLPAPITLNKMDGSLTYPQYVNVIKGQIAYAKEIHGTLSDAAQKLSE